MKATPGEIVSFPTEVAEEQARNAESVTEVLRGRVEAINGLEARPGAYFANGALYAWKVARSCADRLHELSNDMQSAIQVAIEYRQKAAFVSGQIAHAAACSDTADLFRYQEERGDWLRSAGDYESIADMRAQEITELYNGDFATACTATRFFINQVALFA